MERLTRKEKGNEQIQQRSGTSKMLFSGTFKSGKEAKLIHSLLKGRRKENDAVVLGKAVTNEEIKAILIDPNIAGKIVRIV